MTKSSLPFSKLTSYFFLSCLPIGASPLMTFSSISSFAASTSTSDIPSLKKEEAASPKSAAGAAASAHGVKPIIRAETHTLKNGLKIVVLPSGVVPIVTVGMLVHVGTADDPVDEVGLSHFLEHMMFKGTKSIPSNSFKKKILQLGGQTNALTEYDYTLYYTTVSKPYMEEILKMEADRLRNLSFSEKEVTFEKKVVMEERGMRIENNPMGSMFERYLQAFYPYHPYGVLPIGFPHHIEKYSHTSAREHYNKWYRPNNVTLVITGKTSLKEVLPLVEKYFDEYPQQALPPRKRIQNPPRDGVSQKIVQYNKRNSLIILLMSYDAPHFHHLKDKKTYYALQLLSQILGGNEMSDFSQRIVEEKKCAIQVTSEYDGDSIDAKDFSFQAVLSPQMDVEVVRAEIQKAITQIMKEGVSDDILKRAKNDRLAPIEFIKDGTDNYLFTVAQYLGKGRSLEELNAFVEGIHSITSEDIQKAAQLIFEKEPVVVVEVHPEKKSA